MLKKITKIVLTQITYILIKKELEDAVLMDKKGNFFKPFNPNCKTIDIEVIATSLSREKRFFGQTEYTVAQHSVLLARYFLMRGEIEFARQALLHEVGEAYMGDLVSPIKKAFPLFKKIEETIIKKVFDCYKVSYPISQEVEKADKRIMVDEAIKLLPNQEYWLSLNEPLGEIINPWDEKFAYENFISMANEIL
jgi:hypothetical protein